MLFIHVFIKLVLSDVMLTLLPLGGSDETYERATGEEPSHRNPPEPRDCHTKERPTQTGGKTLPLEQFTGIMGYAWTRTLTTSLSRIFLF